MKTAARLAICAILLSGLQAATVSAKPATARKATPVGADCAAQEQTFYVCHFPGETWMMCIKPGGVAEIRQVKGGKVVTRISSRDSKPLARQASSGLETGRSITEVEYGLIHGDTSYVIYDRGEYKAGVETQESSVNIHRPGQADVRKVCPQTGRAQELDTRLIPNAFVDVFELR